MLLRALRDAPPASSPAASQQSRSGMQAKTVRYMMRNSYADWRANNKPVTSAHASDRDRIDLMKLAKTSGARTSAMARKVCPTVETCNKAVFPAKMIATSSVHRDFPSSSRPSTHGATKLSAAKGQKYSSFSTKPQDNPRCVSRPAVAKIGNSKDWPKFFNPN